MAAGRERAHALLAITLPREISFKQLVTNTNGPLDDRAGYEELKSELGLSHYEDVIGEAFTITPLYALPRMAS